MPKKLIKIAGAGVSGLTAAIVLAKAGYRVKVYERNDTVGKRFNGDLQGLMNWGFDEDALCFIKRIGLDANFWYRPIYKVDIYVSDNYKKSFYNNAPFAYLVKRGIQDKSLDKSLEEQAIINGVEIFFNSLKKEDEVDIVATGPNFNRGVSAMASGYIFKTSIKDSSAVIFNKDLAFDGYSYFLVAGGHGVVATCMLGNYNKISNYLDKTYDFLKKHYSFDMRHKRKFTGIANFLLLKSDKRYVGEAGGFQDFLFGFGIRYAMITGYLAAKSVINDENYKYLWENELDSLLKRSLVNRFLFSISKINNYKNLVGLLKNEDNLRDFFTKIYKPNIFSKILYPVAKIYFGKKIKNKFDKKVFR